MVYKNMVDDNLNLIFCLIKKRDIYIIINLNRSQFNKWTSTFLRIPIFFLSPLEPNQQKYSSNTLIHYILRLFEENRMERRRMGFDLPQFSDLSLNLIEQPWAKGGRGRARIPKHASRRPWLFLSIKLFSRHKKKKNRSPRNANARRNIDFWNRFFEID